MIEHCLPNQTLNARLRLEFLNSFLTFKQVDFLDQVGKLSHTKLAHASLGVCASFAYCSSNLDEEVKLTLCPLYFLYIPHVISL